MPAVISFTVETDGRLPTGQSLPEAIAQVDEEGGVAPAYYMINCAHPTHFEDALEADEAWTSRIRVRHDHRHIEEIARAYRSSTVDPVEAHVVHSTEAQRDAAHGA